MPGLKLLRQAVHDPAFMAQRREALDVKANLSLTDPGQC
jgi:hypothetical protein